MFYGIKSLAFLLHETKIGKGGGVDGRGGGEQETPSPSSWYRHLTSSCIISGIFCLQCRLSASWREGSHTHRHAWRIIVVLEGVEEVPS